jgi:hypothetical protein
MADGIKCESCGTFKLFHRRDDPVGVRLYRCGQCGEVKRWCPRCEQGWIRHYRNEEAGSDLYNCEECEVTWNSVSAIGRDEADYEAALNGSFKGYHLVRDFEEAI